MAPLGTAAAARPGLRVAVLGFETVNWLMDVIAHHGLDAAEGDLLDLVELARRQATTIAFQAADAELIVADWLSALRQREAGRALRISPVPGRSAG